MLIIYAYTEDTFAQCAYAPMPGKYMPKLLYLISELFRPVRKKIRRPESKTTT